MPAPFEARRRLAAAGFILVALGTVVLLALVPGPACLARSAAGVSAASGPVVIDGAWARPGMKGITSAVYFTLTNGGDEAVGLETAEADVASTTQVHRTVLEERTGPDGSVQQVMRMEHAGAIVLEPGEQLVFRPGGLHVMLMGLKEDLVEGDRVRLTLFFQGLEPLELEVPVLSPTETGAALPMGAGPGV